MPSEHQHGTSASASLVRQVRGGGAERAPFCFLSHPRMVLLPKLRPLSEIADPACMPHCGALTPPGRGAASVNLSRVYDSTWRLACRLPFGLKGAPSDAIPIGTTIE